MRKVLFAIWVLSYAIFSQENKTTTKKFDGIVTTVSKNLPLVMISIDKNKGISKEVLFAVYRDNKCIGEIIVEHVYKDTASARILKEKMVKAIERGDKILKLQQKTKKQKGTSGKIIHINNRLEVAYIDIGQEDGVLPGFEFQIFCYTKGGEKKVKGYIKVKKVRKNISRVTILSVKDKLEQIVRGDICILEKQKEKLKSKSK